MRRTDKADAIEKLEARLQGSPNLYLTDFTGLSVKPMTELRRKLREVGAEYVVVKNTLALRAIESVSLAGLEDQFRGPTGMVLAGADPVVAAKLLAAFQKEHESLQFKAGIVEGRTLTPEEIKRLATLPSREELMGRLGGVLQAPLQGFVGALAGLLQQFVGAVEALRADRAGA